MKKRKEKIEIKIEFKGESKMSMMCKNGQCKVKKGLCIHEKIMMSVMAIVAMSGLYYWIG